MTSRDQQVGGDHYLNLGIQPWDAMKAWLTTEEFRGYLRGNAIKYLARAGSKGPIEEDLRKAQHYISALLETFTHEHSESHASYRRTDSDNGSDRCSGNASLHKVVGARAAYRSD